MCERNDSIKSYLCKEPVWCFEQPTVPTDPEPSKSSTHSHWLFTVLLWNCGAPHTVRSSESTFGLVLLPKVAWWSARVGGGVGRSLFVLSLGGTCRACRFGAGVRLAVCGLLIVRSGNGSAWLEHAMTAGCTQLSSTICAFCYFSMTWLFLGPMGWHMLYILCVLLYPTVNIKCFVNMSSTLQCKSSVLNNFMYIILASDNSWNNCYVLYQWLGLFVTG